MPNPLGLQSSAMGSFHSTLEEVKSFPSLGYRKRRDEERLHKRLEIRTEFLPPATTLGHGGGHGGIPGLWASISHPQIIL